MLLGPVPYGLPDPPVPEDDVAFLRGRRLHIDMDVLGQSGAAHQGLAHFAVVLGHQRTLSPARMRSPSEGVVHAMRSQPGVLSTATIRARSIRSSVLSVLSIRFLSVDDPEWSEDGKRGG